MATATGFTDFGQKNSTARRDSGLAAARRHSRNVRLLKLLLPLLAFGSAGTYTLTFLGNRGVISGLPALDVGRVLSTDLKMSNPSYNGFGKDGSAYKFNAKTAQQDLLKPDFVKLEGITGQLTQLDKTKTDITATRGTFDNKERVLELMDGIDVVSENGTKAKLQNATMLTKESLLTSKDPVVVEFPAGTINAVGLTLRQKVREVTFGSDVVAHFKPAKADAKPVAAVPAAAPAAAGLFGKSDAPLDVTSQRLDIHDATKIAIFSGNVVAKQGDSEMLTPELTVGYESNTPAGADGSKEAAPANPLAAAGAGKVKQIAAKGPVVMTRGTADRVTSDKADFDAQTETGVLTGNIVMTSGAERRATGDRADLDQKAETVVLTGSNVVVTQGKNELRGQRLFVDRKAAKSQLTAPQSGRIFAQFYQAPKKPGAAPKPAETETPPAAEQGLGGIASFKTDPNAPVKLQANQLDINDTAKTALFTGDVVAEQGDMVMRTAEMNVIYTGGAGLADIGTPADGSAKGPSAQISKIQARKKVVVTTKDGRTVNGDWADFDMKTNKGVVGGDDVVLTQGQNVVHGTRLLIDMVTGESTVDVAPLKGEKKGEKPGGEGWNASETGDGVKVQGGRPSAVFFPQQLKGKVKKPKEKSSGSDGEAASPAN